MEATKVVHHIQQSKLSGFGKFAEIWKYLDQSFKVFIDVLPLEDFDCRVGQVKLGERFIVTCPIINFVRQPCNDINSEVIASAGASSPELRNLNGNAIALLAVGSRMPTPTVTFPL